MFTRTLILAFSKTRSKCFPRWCFFNIHKQNRSFQCENVWRETLMIMALYGLVLEMCLRLTIVALFQLLLALLNLPTYCTTWIIGGAVVSHLMNGKWICLVTVLLILRFTYLFVFISINTIVAILLFLLSSSVPPILLFIYPVLFIVTSKFLLY